MRSHTANKLLKSQGRDKSLFFWNPKKRYSIFKKKEPTGWTLCTKVLRKVDMTGLPDLLHLTKDRGKKNFQTQLSTLLEF